MDGPGRGARWRAEDLPALVSPQPPDLPRIDRRPSRRRALRRRSVEREVDPIPLPAPESRDAAAPHPEEAATRRGRRDPAARSDDLRKSKIASRKVLTDFRTSSMVGIPDHENER